VPGAWERVFGGTTASRGDISFENRVFRDDDDPLTKDAGIGMLGRIEWRHTHAPLEEKVRVYGRLDALDQRRSIMVVEEAWVQVRRGSLRMRAGADIVNWTATEAFHPADVINARNLDSDLENFEKLGEPMVVLMVRVLDGTTVSAYFLPHYTNPIFSSPHSRLHFAPPGLDLRGRMIQTDRDGRLTDDDFGPQGALYVRQVMGQADISVHVVEHMDRYEPLVVVTDPAAPPHLLFQTVRQVGGTYQQVFGPVIAKLEGAYRHFLKSPATPDRDHGKIAVGLEYGLPHESGPESTLVVEGQAVLLGDEALRRSISPFQRDVLGGYRLALNDEAGKELFVGAIFDLETRGEYLVSASYQQRLGETWTIKAGLRIFAAPDSSPAGGIAGFRKSDHVRLTLTRHF
jgi:hypothetical protein